MNDIIKYIIPDYLDFESLKNFCLINKNTYNCLREKVSKLSEINKLFSKRIIEMIGEKRFLKGKKNRMGKKMVRKYTIYR